MLSRFHGQRVLLQTFDELERVSAFDSIHHRRASTNLLQRFVVYKAGSILWDLKLLPLNVLAELPVASIRIQPYVIPDMAL